MALEKQTVVDSVEVTEAGFVQVRTAIRVVEDGTTISQSFHRKTISPGEDYSGQDARVQAICKATHTADVIAAYNAVIAAQGA
jgi:hypothetical protein